jgi:hypothetical protein
MFFFQLPAIPKMMLQSFNYQTITQTIQGTTVNKNAFTSFDLESYKKAAAKPGALTAMLNYYRKNLIPFLPNKKWEILAVSTLMIWGEKDTTLGK